MLYPTILTWTYPYIDKMLLYRFEICIHDSVIYPDIGYYSYIDEEHAEN